MKTKEELLKSANNSFPEFYKSRRLENPNQWFLKNRNFPVVTSITLNSIKYGGNKNGDEQKESQEINKRASLTIWPDEKYENDKRREGLNFDILIFSKIEGLIVIKTRKNRPFRLRFACSDDEDTVKCIAIGRYSRNMAHFIEEFIQYFFYEFLVDEEININEWNNWDIIRPDQ